MTSDHITAAVRALTAAALQTRTTPTGDSERDDFAAIACHVITTVAANLGSLEALLAGRPGSWEADRVRQIVQSTAPDEQLLSYRTEPVRLLLDAAQVLADLGIEALYWEAQAALEDQYAADDLTDQQAEEIDQQLEALDRLHEADLRGYAAAYIATLRQAATERGITVSVEVELVDDGRSEPWWDTLAADLHATAVAGTPLPTSGIPPSDYRGHPGDVDRAAGRTYTARLAGHDPNNDSDPGGQP